MTKIALVGGGNIGGTLGLLTVLKKLGDVAIIDIAEGIAKGKALDIAQAAALCGSNAKIEGGGDWALLKHSDVVITTAGLPRKPGMSRSDLVESNTKIVASVATQIKQHCPKAFVIVITNPLDAMVWVMQKVSGISPQRVVGMAGVLDSARFRHFLSLASGVSPADIQATVLGGHGDSMVPLTNHSTIGGVPLPEVLEQKQLDGLIERTANGGGEIVALLGNGSAFYAPAVAAMEMCEAYLNDSKRQLACAAFLRGEYGQKDIYAGVPVILGKGGVEKVVEIPLSENEKQKFLASVATVHQLISEAKNFLP